MTTSSSWLIAKSALVRLGRSIEADEWATSPGPSIPDLLIAATAELTGRGVLHLDKDFELVAGLAGQQQERLET